MSEFEKLPDHDDRHREYPDTVYFVKTMLGNRIVCSRPGLQLIDFYRTSVVLAGESGKPVVGPGADRMPSQGGSTPPAGATP